MILTKYIDAAMKRAKYEELSDGTIFATVPGLKGLWADAEDRESCVRELRDVLEGWLIVKLRRNEEIPAVGRVSLGRRLDKTA